MRNSEYLQCEKCGHKFSEIGLLNRIVNQIFRGTILVDPALSPTSLFVKERCPKCGSSNLIKMKI